MALPKSFTFSNIPAAQAEGVRRAVLLFGEAWMDECTLGRDRFGDKNITAGKWALSFRGGDLWAWQSGNLNDLPDGSPSGLDYHNSGLIQCTTHACAGREQDPADGSPARVEYHANGLVRCSTHFVNGKPHDPEDGSPATHLYYLSGAIEKTAHYRAGDMVDAADGSPAKVEYYEDGTVQEGWSSKSGGLSPAAVIKILKAVQFQRVVALLTKADQAVVPFGMPLPEPPKIPARKTTTKGAC